MNLKKLLLLCAILFVDLCQGRLAVAAAVSFSETDFGNEESLNEWSPFGNDIPVISRQYKRKLKQVNEKRYYCGVNIDCTPHTPTAKKHRGDFRMGRYGA